MQSLIKHSWEKNVKMTLRQKSQWVIPPSGNQLRKVFPHIFSSIKIEGGKKKGKQYKYAAIENSLKKWWCIPAMKYYETIKKQWDVLADVALLVGASSHKPEHRGFNSWSGHMPELWVLSPVRAHVRGNVSLSNWCISPSFSPTRLLSIKSMRMSLGEDREKIFFNFLNLRK